MGNKCTVLEAWEHKKYLHKNWNSFVKFIESKYLLVHGPPAQERKRKEHTRKKKERAEAARAKRLATSRYWDPIRRSPSPSAVPPQPAHAALAEKLRKVKSVARKILRSEALVETFIAKFPPKL